MAVPARFLMVAIAFLLAGCAASIETGAHYDDSIDFGRYAAFGWITDPPYIGGDPATRLEPAVQQLIESAIRSELEGRGYTFVADRSRADFVIAYTTGARERVREEDYPSRFRGFASWHVPGSLHVVHDEGVHAYTEGTLSIDAFDTRTGKPVWHGWSQKIITDADRRDPTSSIERGMQQLFVKFPRRSQ